MMELTVWLRHNLVLEVHRALSPIFFLFLSTASTELVSQGDRFLSLGHSYKQLRVRALLLELLKAGILTSALLKLILKTYPNSVS